MAVTRIKKIKKTFDYEGDTFYLRPPMVSEQEKLTELMSAYQRSVKKDAAVDQADGIIDKVGQSGDLTLLTKCQVFIAQHLIVDKATGESIFGDGPEMNKIDETPSDFFAQAWFCYTGQLERNFMATRLVDVFGEDWVRKNAVITSNQINLELARLDVTDSPTAHRVRIALDLVKPGVETPDENPTSESAKADETTTSSSVARFSFLQGGSEKVPIASGVGATPAS